MDKELKYVVWFCLLIIVGFIISKTTDLDVREFLVVILVISFLIACIKVIKDIRNENHNIS